MIKYIRDYTYQSRFLKKVFQEKREYIEHET